MTYSIEEIKDSIAYCGLVCKLCNACKTGECNGCREKCDGCSIKECAKTRGINGCWECSKFPCEEKAFKNKRNRVFLQCAKDEGLHSLATYLKKNYDQGIQYHKTDGSIGDYDILKSETEILELLKRRINKDSVYVSCPEFENKRFNLRFISIDDCDDLLKVYSDKKAVPLFNSDNCNGDDFYYTTRERMKQSLDYWKFEYDRKGFVRWSIIDKKDNAVIGTIELFHREAKDYFTNCGLLRLDLRSDYETEDDIIDILKLIIDKTYSLFECNMIATKAIPIASERIKSLNKLNFLPTKNKLIGPDGTEYSSYYFKKI